MNVPFTPVIRRWIAHVQCLRWMRSTLCLVTTLIVLPALAEAEIINSPFDNDFSPLESLFTGTIAKVASLIAIVVGGYQFAHGEPGAKRLSVVRFRCRSSFGVPYSRNPLLAEGSTGLG